MRNLKRVLSLALASVMLLGMMVIGAGAADYTDESSISNIEAAKVMESIGVMQGNDKGEFLPTADLTREAAAKIITYLLLGQKTADGLTAGKAPFADVEAGRWSAGSIAYCAAQGIISGDGKGNFFPTATVTGTQFAKMLLGAAGYKAENEGFTGENYVLNIAKVVSATKLNRGLSSNLSDTLTREEAAQMALNLLGVDMVEYTGGVKIPNGNGEYIEVGAVRNYVKVNDVVQEFMDVYYPNLNNNPISSDAYGRPSHKWTNGKTTVGTYADDVEQTYTSGIKAADIRNDLSGYEFNGSTAIYVNGVQQASLTGTKSTDDNTLDNLLKGKNGRLAEFYVGKTSGANPVYYVKTIVIIDTYLMKINSINTVTEEVMLGMQSHVSVEGGAQNVSYNVTKSASKDLYNKLAEMKSGDYVLVTFDDGKVASVDVPETVTGTFTSYAGATGKRTIGGTTYDTTYKSADKLDNGDSKMVVGNDYVVYLDTYGNVIYASADAVSTAKGAYVMTTETTGNLSIDGSYTYNAKMLFTDGTQQWVKVYSLDGKTAKNDAMFGGMNHLKNNPAFVTYSVRADGSYVLNNVADVVNLPTRVVADDNDTRAYAFSGDITKNTVSFLNTSDVMGSSKTVFLVKNTTDNTYRAYTGIKNIPGWTSVSGTMMVDKKTTTASIVVIDVGGGNAVATKDYVYLLTGTPEANYIDGDTVYTYKAIVNGKVDVIQSMTTTDDSRRTLAPGFYQITSYSGDYVGALAAKSGLAPEVDNKYAWVTDTGFNGTDAKDAIEYSGDTIITHGTNAANINGGKFVTTDDVAVFAVSDTTKSASPISAGDINYYKNVVSYVLIMDSTGAVSTVIFTYGAQ